MSPQRTTGFTLLEVAVASALLVVAVSALLQVMTSTRQIESNALAKDAAAAEAERVLRLVSEDLTTSGWHLPDSEDLNRNAVLDPDEDVDGDGVIGSLSYSNQTIAQDRLAWYFPYVQVQDTTGALSSGLGSRFAHAQRPASATILGFNDPQVRRALPGGDGDATLVFGTGNEAAWRSSFKARSQEIIFLKATIGLWDNARDEFTQLYDKKPGRASFAAVSTASSIPTLNFDFNDLNGNGILDANEALTRADWQTTNNQAKLGVLYSSGWTAVTDASGAIIDYAERTPNQPYGVVLDAGWYDTEAEGTDEDMPLKVQWETMDTPQSSMEDYTPAHLREYTFAVVPSTLGLGRLVRAHKATAASLPAGTVDGYELGNILPVRSATTNYRMLVDRVVSDNVVRIVFDTYRTVDRDVASNEVRTLAPNQIRVRVYVAVRQVTDPSIVICRMSEMVIGMRARSSNSETQASLTALGSVPVGLDR
jgi:type II secretory pathway pseudopilin PulG